jgi:hypothetical protein
VVAVVALTVLAGCGDDQARERPDGTPSKSPSAFDAATSTLVAVPFCEEVDPTLVAGALRMSADKVQLLSEQVVAKERPGTGEASGPSEVNSCTFGAEGRRLAVAVQPEAERSQVERRIEGYRAAAAGRDCQVADDPWFGSPGAVAECEGRGGRRSVAVVGLVGGSGFFCSSVVDAGAGPDLLDATLEVCRDTLETLGVPG